jgi:cytochrome c-type biogenesis protein
MEIQQWATQILNQAASLLPFGYAFGAGMVAAVNPCGFAMLPVYLSLYLGAEDTQFQGQPWIVRLLKAVTIAAVVTAGYGVIFMVIGVIVSAGGSMLMAVMPWIAVVIGISLILLGGWLLLGKHLSIGIFMRIGSRIGDPRNIGLRGYFYFGMGFGATSLSCTLPIFFDGGGWLAHFGRLCPLAAAIFSFVLGTGSILLAMTLAMAFFKGGLVVGVLRKSLPYVQRIAAVLLIVAGGYICFYWISSGLLLLPF